MIAAALPRTPTTPRRVRDYVSWSAINTYLQCALRYKFRYVDQLPEEFMNASLLFGQAIHAALEAYYRQLLTSGTPLGLEGLLTAYDGQWSAVELAQVRFGVQDDLASLRALAVRMLTTFLTHELAAPTGRSSALKKNGVPR